MIPGHISLKELDVQHQDQHRLLFSGVQGVIEKVATTAPNATTLPIGYIQFANISGTYYLYANVNGVIIRFQQA